MVLNFNKYGILIDKSFLSKDDLNKVAFAETKTENELTKKSFVEKFLFILVKFIY